MNRVIMSYAFLSNIAYPGFILSFAIIIFMRIQQLYRKPPGFDRRDRGKERPDRHRPRERRGIDRRAHRHLHHHEGQRRGSQHRNAGPGVKPGRDGRHHRGSLELHPADRRQCRAPGRDRAFEPRNHHRIHKRHRAHHRGGPVRGVAGRQEPGGVRGDNRPSGHDPRRDDQRPGILGGGEGYRQHHQRYRGADQPPLTQRGHRGSARRRLRPGIRRRRRRDRQARRQFRRAGEIDPDHSRRRGPATSTGRRSLSSAPRNQ